MRISEFLEKSPRYGGFFVYTPQTKNRKDNQQQKVKTNNKPTTKQHETEMIKIKKYFALQETVGRQTTTWNEGKRSNEQTTTTARR